jgi:hypothetical protein
VKADVLDLVARHARDRLACSRGKAEFLDATTAKARRYVDGHGRRPAREEG